MNREERRRIGITKETDERLKQLKSPCTVMEAVQLAQGVSEDAISNYHKSINPIIVSLSIQIEVLKELLFKSVPVSDDISKPSIIDENEFINLFKERVEDYNKQKEEAINKMVDQQKSSEDIIVEDSDHSVDVKTNVSPYPVQVEIINKES